MQQYLPPCRGFPSLRFGRLCSSESLFIIKASLQDVALLKEAAEKLISAKDFERGDVMVMNALGDTLVALADAAPDPDAKKAFLLRGLEQGFSAALRIDRRQPDALIGSAEVELQFGRCDFHSRGNLFPADSLWTLGVVQPCQKIDAFCCLLLCLAPSE